MTNLNSIYLVILSAVISFAMTAFVIPKLLVISFRNRLFDIPDERKVHKRITPRLGGISFFPTILFSVGFTMAVTYMFNDGIVILNQALHVQLLLLMCSLTLLYFVGIADDLVGASYRSKFVIQIVCGVILTWSGLWINDLYGILGIHSIPFWIGIPMTILLVVFVINSINLIDGIDGLASGLSSITLLFFGSLLIYQQEWVFAILSFASLGALVAFFYYNVFGTPKKKHKIFMGDTGALTIGMIISFLAVKMIMYDETSTVHVPNAFVVVFSSLIVPLFDVVGVFCCRIRNGVSPFKPDKNHIHHKFLAMGFSHRSAMLIILAIAVVFALANLLLAGYLNINLLIAIDVLGWIFVQFMISKRVSSKVV